MKDFDIDAELNALVTELRDQRVSSVQGAAW